MKIRVGCIIDCEVSGFKEAGEIEQLLKNQVELIVRGTEGVVHYDVGAKERRASKKQEKPKFIDMKFRTG